MPESSDADDLSIADESALWRRIPPRHFVLDENLGRVRPSTAAFENHPDGSGMSVFLGHEVAAGGRKPDDVLAGHENYALVAITAGLARAWRQTIVHRPLVDEPAHAEVCGQ
jgi:hypothetical protein